MNANDVGFIVLTEASWNCPNDSPHEKFDEATAQVAGISVQELTLRIGQALGSLRTALIAEGGQQEDFLIAAFTQGYLMARYVERLAQRAGLQ